MFSDCESGEIALSESFDHKMAERSGEDARPAQASAGEILKLR